MSLCVAAVFDFPWQQRPPSRPWCLCISSFFGPGALSSDPLHRPLGKSVFISPCFVSSGIFCDLTPGPVKMQLTCSLSVSPWVSMALRLSLSSKLEPSFKKVTLATRQYASLIWQAHHCVPKTLIKLEWLRFSFRVGIGKGGLWMLLWGRG